MRPLEGVRVVDWTIWQQGPAASVMLGDLGAEVVKVEDPAGGDPGRSLLSAYGLDLADRPNYFFEANNRNKRSITVNLKTPDGVEIARRLADRSDVFVQNFRKGVAERLGLDYPSLRKRNPRLIYASGTGYGSLGPDSDLPSFDYLGLARSGIMLGAGEPGDPPSAIAGGIADQMGAVMLSYGVLAALHARERSGEGQEVHASLLGSMAWLQALGLSMRLTVGVALPRVPRRSPMNPLWNHYRCADDKWIALAMLQADRYWAPLCQVLGIPEAATDSRFADLRTRAQNSADCVALLDGVFASRDRAVWLRRLAEGGDFVVAPVNSVDDLPDDPQMIANGYIAEYDHPTFGPTRAVGPPVGLSRTPAGIQGAAPELGQHTEEVLVDLLGYSRDDVARLRANGVT